MTSLCYCDVCGGFEGTRKEVEEHASEEHDDLDPRDDVAVPYRGVR
jgi:hypothetical protein